MKYEYMADFDTENVEDEQTMAERFYFSDNVNKYSYNQAVFTMGKQPVSRSKLFLRLVLKRRCRFAQTVRFD